MATAGKGDHVHDETVPFASVHGSYALVLRSFQNWMVTTRRITRIVMGQDDKPLPVPKFVTEMQDLTVIRFLSEAATRSGHPLVGVSNGTSLNGALCLVHTPEARWFDAMRVLAENARVIIVIPDDSTSLLQEIAHVTRAHAPKVLVLMPPSMRRVRFERDLLKVFRIEWLDLSAPWGSTRQALKTVGVDVASYESCGGLLTWDDATSSFARRIPWALEDLTTFIRSLEPAPGAEAARLDLLAIGLPLRHYSMPPRTEGDPSWNRYPFHPASHLERLMAMAESDDIVADNLSQLDLPQDLYAACEPPWPPPPPPTSAIWQILSELNLLPMSALSQAGRPCTPAVVAVLAMAFEEDAREGGLLGFLRGPRGEYLREVAQAFATIGATETARLLSSVEHVMAKHDITLAQFRNEPRERTECTQELGSVDAQLFTRHPVAEPVAALLHAYAARHRRELMALLTDE